MLVVMNDKTLSRRAVVAGLPLLLAGCSGGYRSITGELYSVPFVSMHPDLMRQEVAYGAPYRTGTVVVNIRERRLYLVQAGGRALRYAVGVGRAEARNFHGSAVIGRKEPWPSWTPTANMMRAMPHYRAYASGMAGGTENPLGARALYLYRDGEDTYFRLHGTNEPDTIGTAVSSGCIRLVNQDIIDLYNRVPVGAPVVVLQT
jgi:lipoprotein-anchoring transpeptidase ErfK/SrfK